MLDRGLLAIAALLMLISLVYENITTTGDYRAVLLTALAAMTIADAICVQQCFGRGRKRWIAILIALPSLFVVWDFARRAPHVWKMY